MKAMSWTLRVAAALCVPFFAAPFAPAHAAAPEFVLPRAEVLHGRPGKTLTAPSRAALERIVGDFLRGRGASAATVGSLRTVAVGKARNGIVQLRMTQEVGGLTVYGSYVKAAVSTRGELVQLIERIAPVPEAAPAAARIGAEQALVAALARLYPGEQIMLGRSVREGNTVTFPGDRFFHSAPRVTAVAVPAKDASMAVGFLVETWSEKRNLLHETLVGGDGRVLNVELRTADDSYNVFVEDPSKGSQTVTPGPGSGNAQSPIGWLGTGSQSTINISGNNANAYLDTDHNNRADRGGTTVSDGNFLTLANLSLTPSTDDNRAVSVQNLFYLNNVVHDLLYTHGFDEAAGNFQADNFGNGGKDRDPVQAEAQDGGGTDNANFATPRDGRPPRMQMYLWTGAGNTHEVVEGSAIYPAKGAEFGPALDATGVTGDLRLADDGVGAVTDACEAIANDVSGRIALVDRGTCTFVTKVLNAQLAGATGVVVANNAGDDIFTMGGSQRRIRIPSVLVGQSDGGTLRSGTHHVTIRLKAQQPLQIDASLDSDVVFHEYGHGLTWRMIGGMDGPLAGAIGEGASDGLAMLINGDDRMGEYSSSNPNGIRRDPYHNYPRTYADVTGAEVHDDGEIYAAIIWRLKELFDANAIPIPTLLGYFVDGMNYTPATPAFEDMRNGMLQAASASAAHCALIWQAFAQYGVGDGASGVVSPSGGVTVTESTSARSDCSY